MCVMFGCFRVYRVVTQIDAAEWTSMQHKHTHTAVIRSRVLFIRSGSILVPIPYITQY